MAKFVIGDDGAAVASANATDAASDKVGFFCVGGFHL